MRTALIPFLAGDCQDHKGRSVEDYLNFSDREMEIHHDFIQWWFPTKTPSKFSQAAGVLTDADVLAFKHNASAQINAHTLRLKYAAYARLHPMWNNPDFNHNYMRITRAIESTRLLVSDEEADHFFSRVCLPGIRKGLVSAETVQFWMRTLGC